MYINLLTLVKDYSIQRVIDESNVTNVLSDQWLLSFLITKCRNFQWITSIYPSSIPAYPWGVMGGASAYLFSLGRRVYPGNS